MIFVVGVFGLRAFQGKASRSPVRKLRAVFDLLPAEPLQEGQKRVKLRGNQGVQNRSVSSEN